MRIPAVIAGIYFLCVAAMAQETYPGRVELSLSGDRHLYKIGEAIQLQLSFTADEEGLSLNMTTTEPASPIDTLVISPMTGVFPWLDEQARGRRYYPDYAALSLLQVGKPQTVTLPLNAVYRFDAPGHYTLHVVTHRVMRRGMMPAGSAGEMTSNAVTFDIEPMDENEEANRATRLEQQIRQASDRETAQTFADQLDWLTGNASIPVKLSLFLNPKSFYPFNVNVSRGLWIARNRAVVVAGLERAFQDPSQSLDASSSLFKTAVALKAQLKFPFDPANPPKAAPVHQIEDDYHEIEDEYLKLLAASLPARRGQSLVTAARTVFVELAQKKTTSGPDFAAAREVLLTHFAEVSEFSIDGLLNSYGKYLEDPRIIPALEQVLQKQHDQTSAGTRTAVLNQLARINSAGSRSQLVFEICGDNPTLLQIARHLPYESLPETDDCLTRKIHAAAESSKVPNLKLQWATEFASRFATPAVLDDLLALYLKSGSTWDKQAQGYLLAYLVRWNPQRGVPLLEKALPAEAPEPDFDINFALGRAYSQPLELFWRSRLESKLPAQAEKAAWQLSTHGPVEDQSLLRARLDTWRGAWKDRVIPETEGDLEAQLLRSVIHGKNWQMSESEARVLSEGCLSANCRTSFPVQR